MLAGRYELKRRIGRGGMATVFEAHDELLDRAVAVKLLDTRRMQSDLKRFAAEARAAAALTHPHVVGVYDVGIEAEFPFIVLELIRGTTLQNALDDGAALSVRHTVAVGCQLLAALHQAHGHGLIHRDVKPANILLPGGVLPSHPSELPGVKLADFGIAKVLRGPTLGLTTAGQAIGTPRYMSPEQVRGERPTPRSDLYSLGVVLFEMLAGRPPFEHDNPIAVALAHKDEYPPSLAMLRDDIDHRLVVLVHRALAKRPDLRPSSARRMRAALLDVLTVRPDHPTTQPTSTSGGRRQAHYDHRPAGATSARPLGHSRSAGSKRQSPSTIELGEMRRTIIKIGIVLVTILLLLRLLT